MNLTDLFNQQRKLDEEIERKHPVQPGEDRLAKKLLALSVELGECANEWRGFKFWSENQKSNTYSISPIFATEEDGTPYQSHRETNPLLEEYIDCLHFALSIGNELNVPNELVWESYRKKNITEQFTSLLQNDWGTYHVNVYHGYCRGLELLLGLGEALGFTWRQIEQAYNDKNKTNWERQATGY